MREYFEKVKIENVSFGSLLPEPMGSSLDAYFEKNSWALQAWDTGEAKGYQVFFGEGVQVDNNFEYGFPYLYDKDELLAFAKSLYESRVCEKDVSHKSEIRILSVEECTDEAYGATLVQYCSGDIVSFCFSDIPFEQALTNCEGLFPDIQEQLAEQSEMSSWTVLSDRLLEVVLVSPFDMHFVEKDEDGWTSDVCDKLFEEISNLGLYGAVTVGEDDALVTVYAGAMGSINWSGHPLYGQSCLMVSLNEPHQASLEDKIQTAEKQKMDDALTKSDHFEINR